MQNPESKLQQEDELQQPSAEGGKQEESGALNLQAHEKIIEAPVNLSMQSPQYEGNRGVSGQAADPDGEEESQKGSDSNNDSREDGAQGDDNQPVADFAEGDHDEEYNRNHGGTEDATVVGNSDKKVQPPTSEEVESILGEFFRIIDTYCEMKETKTWRSKFINYWAGKRMVNVEPLMKIGQLDWLAITEPTLEEHKFQHQLDSRYSLD